MAVEIERYQKVFALSTVSYAVSRQSAGETIIEGFVGEVIGLAVGLSLRAKKELNVLVSAGKSFVTYRILI